MFLYSSVQKVSSVSVISVEACFVYVHQLFMDASRELHRVKQGWLYSFSHLRCAPEEIRLCLLRIPVYWQQHLLWIFCKAFYMVNPTLYCKNSTQIKIISSSFPPLLSSLYVHSLLLLNKIKKCACLSVSYSVLWHLFHLQNSVWTDPVCHAVGFFH